MITSDSSACVVLDTADGQSCIQDTEGDYEVTQECSFTLKAAGTVTRVEWALEQETNCAYDYVEVDGDAKYCGATTDTATTFPESMTLPGPTSFVFVSDGSGNFAGFKLCVAACLCWRLCCGR